MSVYIPDDVTKTPFSNNRLSISKQAHLYTAALKHGDCLAPFPSRAVHRGRIEDGRHETFP